MKIVALGDTHGRTKWKNIVANNDFDKLVFIGDYFDTREGISAEQQKQNFKDILAFKKANKDQVILLIGNHDYHYCPFVQERYSQFQGFFKEEFRALLMEALKEDFLQICYQHEKFLFTHAGVSKVWCENHNVNLDNIEASINSLFKSNPSAFSFGINGHFNPYGDEKTQSPIWIRPKSLYASKVSNYIHVVGHTTQDKITGLNGSMKIYVDGEAIETSGVIFIDTLGTSGEYLEILDGIAKAKI